MLMEHSFSEIDFEIRLIEAKPNSSKEIHEFLFIKIVCYE